MRRLVIPVLILGMLTLAACGWHRHTANDEVTLTERITGVRVANDHGQVKIRTGDLTSVRRVLRYDGNRPGVTHRVEGTTLIIESCRMRNCSIDYEITVPAGSTVDGSVDSGDVELDGVASVNLKSDSGSVTVRGVAGQVNVDSDAGSVNIVDVGGAVAVKSDSGQVSVKDVRAAVTVEADSGSVEAIGVGGALEVRTESGDVTAGLASPRDLRAEADSGNLTVVVPRGTYRVRTVTDSGDITSDVANDASGSHALDLHTDSGDITLRYA